MRWIGIGRATGLVCFLGGLSVATPVRAEEPAAEAPAEELVEKRVFSVKDVIHPVVANLPLPEFDDRIVALRMPISTHSEEAEKHVLQGMALIHAAWDFEAYRHFCAAAELDPECVMAYWGITLALAAPNNEFLAQRAAAIDRMLDLLDLLGDKLPVIEQEYAIALAQLFSENPGDCAKSLEGIVEKYPRNLQAGLLATFLQRDGYTEFGDALYGQEQAIRKMKQYVEAHPDNLSVLSFWAMLHAEAPDAEGDLRENVLPYVRKMARLVPDFPPYQHLLGHFEWRCGNLRLAQEAFERSSELYAAYMARNKVTFLDCDGWVRSRLYLATACYSSGEIKKALAVASELTELEVDPVRLGSAGANLVVWEGRTLPARIYLARGAGGDFELAKQSLPGKDDDQLFKDRSLAVFYLEGLRQYLACRQALMDEDLDSARNIREAMAATGAALIDLQGSAMRSSAISEYIRAAKTLEVHALELRGLLALQGDPTQRGLAYNWFKSAIDKQVRPTMLVPPATLYPMELRLADFYLRSGDAKNAAEVFKEGLDRRPNDLATLIGYHSALLQLDRKEDAALIQKQIDLVQGR